MRSHANSNKKVGFHVYVCVKRQCSRNPILHKPNQLGSSSSSNNFYPQEERDFSHIWLKRGSNWRRRNNLQYTCTCTWYESTHFLEAHQEVFGNMGISNFKKGTRQKAHGEQQKLRERWNAFSYLLLHVLGNRGTHLLIWGERKMEQISASPWGSL